MFHVKHSHENFGTVFAVRKTFARLRFINAKYFGGIKKGSTFATVNSDTTTLNS